MKIHTKDLILVALFTSLMVVGAFIKIPFPLLPITLQPFFCAFAGLILGSRLGALSQALYVVMGLVGLPVFSSGGGLTYIFMPSFGFLLGFIISAFVIGKISESFNKITLKNALLSVTSGFLVIYAIGIPYMFLILKFYLNKPSITFWYIITTNFPYMIKDLILFLIVAYASVAILPVIKKTSLK
jgi:biotin transport system substrate-specific component